MRPASKFAITILVLTLSAVFLSSHNGKAQPQDVRHQRPETLPFQERERVIKKSKDFNPPVSIEAVKTKGRFVPLDKKFIDGDDWLKGFAVLVRNNSNKAVTHIGVKLLFRRIGGVIPAAWILSHGPDPFLDKTGDGAPRSAIPSVLPGGEIELKLSDAELEDLKSFLKNVGFPDKIHAVEVRVNKIGFTDGTAWYGKMLKRGSGNVKWIRAARPAAPLYHHPQAGRSAHGRPVKFLFLKQPCRRRLTG